MLAFKVSNWLLLLSKKYTLIFMGKGEEGAEEGGEGAEEKGEEGEGE